MTALSPMNALSFNHDLQVISEKPVSFSKEIEKDPELFFLVNLMAKALPAQLKRFEELYIYEEIEKGDIFDALSETSVTTTVDQVIDLIKILAKHSYYREETFRLHKVCKGHFEERVRDRVRYRSRKHIEKEEKKILEEWKQKVNIKPSSITIKKIVYRNASCLWRLADFYVNYTHLENIPECSYPKTKAQFVQDVCFTSVLERFESKIKNFSLNWEREWGVLAQKIFGSNLILI